MACMNSIPTVASCEDVDITPKSWKDFYYNLLPSGYIRLESRNFEMLSENHVGNYSCNFSGTILVPRAFIPRIVYPRYSPKTKAQYYSNTLTSFERDVLYTTVGFSYVSFLRVYKRKLQQVQDSMYTNYYNYRIKYARDYEKTIKNINTDHVLTDKGYYSIKGLRKHTFDFDYVSDLPLDTGNDDFKRIIHNMVFEKKFLTPVFTNF